MRECPKCKGTNITHRHNLKHSKTTYKCNTCGFIEKETKAKSKTKHKTKYDIGEDKIALLSIHKSRR